MSDVSISDGLGGTAVVGTRTMADGSEVQEFLLVRSDTTTTTYTTNDANGLLVNLGSNNDVTISGGTVTVGGTATASVAGTASVLVVGGTAVATLGAGAALAGYVGLSADGTAVMDILSLTNGTAAAVGILDGDGDQVAFAAPAVLSVTPTLDTSPYASGDSMDTTVLSFTSAASESGGSGHVLRMTVVDRAAQDQDMKLHLFEASVTPATENTAHALGTADGSNYIGTISTSDGTWQSHGTAVHTVSVTPAPPLPYKLDSGTTLYGVLVSAGTGTYAAGSVDIKLHVLKD